MKGGIQKTGLSKPVRCIMPEAPTLEPLSLFFQQCKDERLSPLSEPAKNEHSTPRIMYKNCLVSWTLFMFRCTLMADASFCNYWTVLIVKIKCIQTKKNKKNKKKIKRLSRSNGLFPVFNFWFLFFCSIAELWFH